MGRVSFLARDWAAEICVGPCVKGGMAQLRVRVEVAFDSGLSKCVISFRFISLSRLV